MSEIRSIITGTTSKSLVLIDEICRGTETAKGTCIAGSVVEALDETGCLGIISTHLHGIFDLPLKTKNVVYKAMGSERVDGQTIPTWKLIDGVCKESLAFETAQREGVPESIIQRAEELYVSVYAEDLSSNSNQTTYGTDASGADTVDIETANEKVPMLFKDRSLSYTENLQKEVELCVRVICNKRLTELYKKENTGDLSFVNCIVIRAREQPPPSTIGASSVYVMFRPDRKLYVGETDDLEGRVRAHRLKNGMENSSFLYFIVPGKSIACQLETLLINQLSNRGFHLANIADGNHRNFGTSTTLSLESMTTVIR